MSDPEKPHLTALEAKLHKLLDPKATQLFRRKKRVGPYAYMNERILAVGIDTIWIFFLLGPVVLQLRPMIYGAEDYLAMFSTAGTLGDLLSLMYGSGFLSKLALEYFLSYLIVAPILVAAWTYSSATPGKWLLRMRIVDAETFRKPSNAQFMIRVIGYPVSILPCLLGIFWGGIDRRKQTWHDKLAGTVVVKVRHWRIRDDGIEPHIVPDVITEDQQAEKTID